MKEIVKNIIFLGLSLLLIITGTILERFAVKEMYLLLIYGAGFIIGVYHILIHAIQLMVKKKSLSVDFLMIIAAIGAFYIGEYREGTVLILIFGLAHILEDYATLKSEKTFTSLLKIAPEEATLVKDNIDKIVNIGDLEIGQTIKVKVGEQIAVDGVIIDGHTAINEKTITGEFLPSEKKVGDSVYAGTINITSTILVRVEKDPKETVAQKIIEFVKSAQKDKTEKETLISKIEKWYVYAVILLALIVMFVPPLFGIWDDKTALTKGIIVFVVASPCALVASVTPAILSSLSNGANRGILIKGGSPLEKARTIDTVVFDKTGTITEGLPMVEGYEVYGVSEEEFLRALTSIEKESNHPLALAIVDHFSHVDAVDVITKEKAGTGIEGKIGKDLYLVGRFEMEMCETSTADVKKAILDGHTVVSVGKNKTMIGFVKLKDTIRKDAYEAISKLNKNNVKTHMLTGDHFQIAQNVANELNISSFRSELFPEEKVEEINKLKKENRQIMMIGDGINDAPALAASDVGVAMGSATDVSLEVADIVFINDKLDNVNIVMDLSKRMNRIVIQNIIFSMLVIVVLLSVNLFSEIKISLGVLSHEGSTILVILNSLRLLRIKK